MKKSNLLTLFGFVCLGLAISSLFVIRGNSEFAIAIAVAGFLGMIICFVKSDNLETREKGEKHLEECRCTCGNCCKSKERICDIVYAKVTETVKKDDVSTNPDECMESERGKK